MATTALSTLRQGMGMAIWQFSQVFTTTSVGNAGGTTLICTGITEIPDSLDQMYVLLTSGASATEIQRVTSTSTSTITVETAFSAQIASGVTFELHPFYPTLMTNALNRAAADLMSWLNVKLFDETLIVDNLITNFDFETFPFDGWTHTAGTWTQESTRVRHLLSSATSSASGADSQLTQNLFTSVNIHEVVGKTLYFAGWVWASDASAARLRVSFDGGATFTNSEYHRGESEWQGNETMFINVNIPAGAISMTLYLEVADGSTAFFDLVHCSIMPIMRYTVPTAITEGPSKIQVQKDHRFPQGHYRSLEEGERPQPGALIRMSGRGPLTTLSVDTSTVEIGEPQVQLLIAGGLRNMYETLAQTRGTPDSQAEKYQGEASRWAGRQQELIRRPSIATGGGMAAEWPRSWILEGRTVTFLW